MQFSVYYLIFFEKKNYSLLTPNAATSVHCVKSGSSSVAIVNLAFGKLTLYFEKKNDEIYVETKLIAKNAGKRMKVDVNVANQLGVHFTHHSNCYQLIFALDNCKCHLFGIYVFD